MSGKGAFREFMRNRSVNKLLLTCFLVVAFVPIMILGLKVYDAAWDNALREVKEKHLLLAQNLGEPIREHINGHKKDLPIIARLVSSVGTQSFRNDIFFLLDDYVKNTEGLDGLTIFSGSGSPVLSSYRDDLNPSWATFAIADKPFFKAAMESNKATISRIYRSTATGRPALFMAHTIEVDEAGGATQILVSELNMDRVEALRQGIKFGKRGHCAIVDATGFVVAHPNPDWREEIRDLSKLDIVQKMMAGETGVMQFYSPFVKQTMIAGYTSVPELGWGIMVPQPRAEVEEQVSNIILVQLIWGAMGFLIAVVLAITLAKWITQPINALARVADDMMKSKFTSGWSEAKLEDGPKEINRLANVIQQLVIGLLSSRAKIESNNKALQLRVDIATEELRQVNKKLAAQAKQDHLTGLPNRRNFDEYLLELRGKDSGKRKTDTDKMTVIMLDIDRFKQVNDTYGHLAGDLVIAHFARIIGENMREDDFIARYAGDEFVGIIKADMNVARKRAEDIRKSFEHNPAYFDDKPINVTCSIGLMECQCPEKESDVIKHWENVIKMVDSAMYEAKQAGRNNVAEVHKQVKSA